jgi:hypothetical protein
MTPHCSECGCPFATLEDRVRFDDLDGNRIVDVEVSWEPGLRWSHDDLSIVWIIGLCWFEGCCDSRRRWATDASIGSAREVFAAYVARMEGNRCV